MAWTSVGYDGTVDETADARRSPYIGVDTPVVAGAGDFLVTIDASVDRSVFIAPGTAWGFGVMSTQSVQQGVQLPTIASGFRWDAIVLRRTWSTNTDTITYVQNNVDNVQALPTTGLNNNPGVIHDQVLALARVANGTADVTDVLDLRARASKVITADSLMAIPSPTLGMHAIIAGTHYRRVLDSTSTAVWSGETIVVYKDATETVTSSTTLQNDDKLFLTLPLGVWHVRAFLAVSGAQAGDFKMAWNFTGTSAGALSARWCLGPGVPTTDTTSTNAVMRAAGQTVQMSYGTDGTGTSAIMEDLTFTVTVEGVLTLQWAQNTSSGTGTVMNIGSRIVATRVS